MSIILKGPGPTCRARASSARRSRAAGRTEHLVLLVDAERRRPARIRQRARPGAPASPPVDAQDPAEDAGGSAGPVMIVLFATTSLRTARSRRRRPSSSLFAGERLGGARVVGKRLRGRERRGLGGALEGAVGAGPGGDVERRGRHRENGDEKGEKEDGLPGRTRARAQPTEAPRLSLGGAPSRLAPGIGGTPPPRHPRRSARPESRPRGIPSRGPLADAAVKRQRFTAERRRRRALDLSIRRDTDAYHRAPFPARSLEGR